MKLLLDMHLSVEIAHQMRASGNDAFQLRERGLQRLADEKVAELALAEGPVLVSFDLDFSDIPARTGASGPSLIQFRTDNARTDVIATTLRTVIPQYASDLQTGCILCIDPDRVRVRRLPIVVTRNTRSET